MMVPTAFPFCADETEDTYINLERNCSLILVGRSGTGKITIALHRMWAPQEKFVQLNQAGMIDQEPFHQVFLTANSVLRDQVEKSFRSLQGRAATVVRKELDVAKTRDDDFPLFLTSKDWLSGLDAVLDGDLEARKTREEQLQAIQEREDKASRGVSRHAARQPSRFFFYHFLIRGRDEANRKLLRRR